MTAVEEARAAVEQEVTAFNKMVEMMEASPERPGGKMVLLDTWVSMLSTVVAQCHQSNMKLLLALEELEAKG